MYALIQTIPNILVIEIDMKCSDSTTLRRERDRVKSLVVQLEQGHNDQVF